jgi:UDP-glucose 4-epimerase
MKILITGASGFIGKNLKEQLINKYEIYTPNSSEINLLDDKLVYEYLKNNLFDVILHTATWNATRTSSKDITKVFENNLHMFFNLVKGDEFYSKLINFGSGAEFDRNHWIPKMKEEYFNTFIPTDQYGFSKYIINKYIEKSEKIYNLRLFGVFGKHEDWQIRYISQTCCRAMFDCPIIINQNVNFDYTYIDDLIKISDWFINNTPKEKVFNICSGEVFDLFSLAQKVLKISNKKLPVVILNDNIGKEYSGDNKKLLNELINFKFSNIDENIKDIYQWYSQNKKIVNKVNLY